MIHHLLLVMSLPELLLNFPGNVNGTCSPFSIHSLLLPSFQAGHAHFLSPFSCSWTRLTALSSGLRHIAEVQVMLSLAHAPRFLTLFSPLPH